MADPAAPDALAPETWVEMYRSMLTQRRFEEHAARAYGMGKIYGFCHLYIGQEAISTAAAQALDVSKGDIMVSGYRIHAMALAMGIPPQDAMDELFGRASGNVQGLGGSMHMFDTDKGFYGGWGLVGQQVPMGVGLAFGRKYLNEDAVTTVFFGDGALQQGAIHEAFNMASVWDIPVVFVLENNKYGMGTAIERVSALAPEAAKMADAYHFERDTFNGMDLLESYGTFKKAIDTARETQRPVFLEARCSRFRGHSMSDPGKYRTKDQLQEEKDADPLPKFASWLQDQGFAAEDELTDMDKGIKADMKQVLKDAEAADWPSEDLIDKYVYANPID